MSSILPQVIFAIVLGAAIAYFNKSMQRIRHNILLGRDTSFEGSASQRWLTMLKVAIGQSKMVKRPVSGIFHIFIYVGFLVVNIEVLEIIMDGLTGSHRILAGVLGPAYNLMTVMAELFLILVFLSCVVFLIRRNVVKVPRFSGKEMTTWPKMDGNIILLTEIVLVIALVVMNASDQQLQLRGADHYAVVGVFPVSSAFVGLFSGISTDSLIAIERGAWWVHIVGIFLFLNYIPYSKHLHVFLSFPNTYFSNLNPLGRFPLNETVKREVNFMMNPEAAEEEPQTDGEEPQRFGARDVQDLSWKNLMDAYTCTECGRCTSSCPANITGKLLSPRKIMMDTRDRLEEVGANIKQHGTFQEDGKALLGDYISHEELWACNTCNACTEACPVNIDPLSIILQMRQYLVMEESGAPEALNAMFTNVENNGAPWAMSAMDRFNWADNLEMKKIES